ncbi:hypothetical protein [Chondromyces crocatus]|uniref:1,4-alpha-glucan branching enzyme n=1 Tax=Chondromyces crocatus TaxID=52 RepID=A0A0K1ER10_CHOCO|nr:hypothetical protein [Chondromyces crocatus]AKT43254.1 uncharacterized protein CMC5_074850 [Chondromyces crocatus]
MNGAGKATMDHEVIRQWVEQRGGTPSHVKGRGTASDAGILRIDFPGYSGEDTLEAISWEQWFKTFDESNLAFLFQERTADGQESRFNKLINRDNLAPSVELVKRSEPEERSGSSRERQSARAEHDTHGPRGGHIEVEISPELSDIISGERAGEGEERDTSGPVAANDQQKRRAS